jgi:hypothetical protein
MAWVRILLFCDADIERCNESEVEIGGLGAPLGKLGNSSEWMRTCMTVVGCFSVIQRSNDSPGQRWRRTSWEFRKISAAVWNDDESDLRRGKTRDAHCTQRRRRRTWALIPWVAKNIVRQNRRTWEVNTRAG